MAVKRTDWRKIAEKYEARGREREQPAEKKEDLLNSYWR
jgi:hypothetical protein